MPKLSVYQKWEKYSDKLCCFIVLEQLLWHLMIYILLSFSFFIWVTDIYYLQQDPSAQEGKIISKWQEGNLQLLDMFGWHSEIAFKEKENGTQKHVRAQISLQ